MDEGGDLKMNSPENIMVLVLSSNIEIGVY